MNVYSTYFSTNSPYLFGRLVIFQHIYGTVCINLANDLELTSCLWNQRWSKLPYRPYAVASKFDHLIEYVKNYCLSLYNFKFVILCVVFNDNCIIFTNKHLIKEAAMFSSCVRLVLVQKFLNFKCCVSDASIDGQQHKLANFGLEQV